MNWTGFLATHGVGLFILLLIAASVTHDKLRR